ncbi:MAG TPA: 3-hydroxyacyl-CoA dehydrogenase family protein [Candidatus Binataceae bacterium]|nr:3-hydroxyacyl-CoA dehydrogenase family protein [Candidatus Binataceae bacterium]
MKVVILGANGAMGATSGAVFAGAGWEVVSLARDLDKAQAALVTAQNAARAEAVAERVKLGTYDEHLDEEIADADLIFESLAEDIELKKAFFERVDKCRRPDSIVASGSSGLSIAEMARGRSDSFRKHFLGIHLFNPPQVIVGTEVIPHPETDPKVTREACEMLAHQLGRKVIVTRDRPAFVGNRVGFKVLNECAQLSEEHGVAFIDYVVGPHTGRAMAPLATIDLVGWDVHKAIVDNVYAHTEDEAHAAFRMPSFMERGIKAGQMGDKTPKQGGFYRKDGKSVEALDPKSGAYQTLPKPAPIPFVERMKHYNREGRYAQAFGAFADARGAEADLMRRVILGYVSYALNRVGEVAESARDVDIIMSYGFNWAPPSAIVDLIGAKNIVKMFEQYNLMVPPVVEKAATIGGKLYYGEMLDYGRTLVG